MASKSNVTTRGESSVSPITPFRMMLRAMSNDASAEDATFGGDDLNAILTAETEQEMWEADERPPLNFQHLTGCEIAVLSFAVKYSRGSNNGIASPFVTEDGKKMYLLVKCVRIGGDNPVIKLPPIGEVFEANTSARFVVAKLWRAQTLGMIDESFGRSLECSVQGTDLGDGQTVIKLKPINKRVVPSTVSE